MFALFVGVSDSLQQAEQPKEPFLVPSLLGSNTRLRLCFVSQSPRCCLLVGIPGDSQHVAQQEEEKLAVASSSKAASRFAYDVLANADEAAKAPGVKRGKDGHVQLPAADDFFSSPLSNKSSAAK